MDLINNDLLLNNKLKVKEQWICDLCGGVIESAKDGMLEWDSYLPGEKDITAERFRIVHGRWMPTCKGRRDDRNLRDGHLHWYTGSEGLSELLELRERNIVNDGELDTIIRRLHVDYYEEGHRLVEYAREDGKFDFDHYDNAHIKQDGLITLIRRYSDR